MSKLIKRQDVIELIKNSYYDLANSEDDMWAMVADVEKLPVIETEDLFHNEKENVLKENFGDMDAQIDSVMGNLEWIQDECDRALDHTEDLEIQYEQLKKKYKQLQENIVPVRYGRYIMGENGECYCSECKRIDDKYSVARYCWFCGAWMQGEENRF